MLKKRNELMAEADKKLKQGLNDLAKTFPQMATANNRPLDEALNRDRPQAGRLSIGDRPEQQAGQDDVAGRADYRCRDVEHHSIPLLHARYHERLDFRNGPQRGFVHAECVFRIQPGP